MSSTKAVSLIVSDVLDELGYSYLLIKHRQKEFDECDKITNSDTSKYHLRVTTGGKGEGTVLLHESDTDYMFIVSDVISADYPEPYQKRENIMLFQTEREDTSPGYTRLKPLKLRGKSHETIIRSSVVETITGTKYLSSDMFTKEFIKKETEARLREGFSSDPVSGPSAPTSNKYTEFDEVAGFKCNCPDILQRWIIRHRHYDWPPPDIIDKISDLDSHVVPVGFKGSPNVDKEWRICYSLAELQLMQILNEPQIKLYVLLKQLAKSVLKPVCKDMTSYIMKNVVLWVFESWNMKHFEPKHLTKALVSVVAYLKKRVTMNELPSYMIPERNLFAGRLELHQRQELIKILCELLEEGEHMLLRCDRLRDALTVIYKTPGCVKVYQVRGCKLESLKQLTRRVICMTPHLLKEFRKMRDKIEFFCLAMMKIRTQVGHSSSDEINKALQDNYTYRHIQVKIAEWLSFNSTRLQQMGFGEDEIVDIWYTRIKEFLS